MCIGELGIPSGPLDFLPKDSSLYSFWPAGRLAKDFRSTYIEIDVRQTKVIFRVHELDTFFNPLINYSVTLQVQISDM
jgi:hypothetical protein